MDNCINKNAGNFNINQLGGIDYDNCAIKSSVEQSKGPGKYTTKNYYDCECEAPYTRDLSLNNPGVLYQDGNGWTSNGGCNIDNDSKLRNDRNLTNLRSIHQLTHRMHGGVPYMGRGLGHPDTESELIHGIEARVQRPCNIAGASRPNFIPQVPCIKNNIQNPKYIVPEDSMKSWVRGGQPSRQVVRNSEWLERCGYKYNGRFWTKNNKEDFWG